MIKDAIYESSIDEFEEISDKPVTEENNKDRENSTKSQEAHSDTQNQNVNNPSQEQTESDTERKEQTKIDFHVRKNGTRLNSQVAW